MAGTDQNCDATRERNKKQRVDRSRRGPQRSRSWAFAGDGVEAPPAAPLVCEVVRTPGATAGYATLSGNGTPITYIKCGVAKSELQERLVAQRQHL